MTSILTAGLAVIDMLFVVDSLPNRPEKYIANEARMVGGGGAANAAVALARLNVSALLLARVGDDLLGNRICEELHHSGVDCSLVQKATDGQSSFSSVLVDADGERQIVNFRGNGLSEVVPELAHLQLDAVLADTRWPEATVTVFEHAREKGIPAVLDAEAPVSLEAVQLASHIAFSAQGLRAYSQIDDIKRALLEVKRSVDGFVCVTDGCNGVLYVDDGAVHPVPAYTINAIDTLGAGDVWHAAFAFYLSKGQDEVAAMQFANAAAALKCMRKGGGRESPTLGEVLAFIDERGQV